jgi:hypothetical protein
MRWLRPSWALTIVEQLDVFFRSSKSGLQLFITSGLPTLLQSLSKRVFVDLVPGDIGKSCGRERVNMK